jgi:hypothetical protein
MKTFPSAIFLSIIVTNTTGSIFLFWNSDEDFCDNGRGETNKKNSASRRVEKPEHAALLLKCYSISFEPYIPPSCKQALPGFAPNRTNARSSSLSSRLIQIFTSYQRSANVLFFSYHSISLCIMDSWVALPIFGSLNIQLSYIEWFKIKSLS